MPQSPAILPPIGTLLPFALLHHSGLGQPHYDLLLQIPSQKKLLTWRFAKIPTEPPAAGLPPPTRSPDHRPRYLTYEGKISGNRGQVQRISAGHAELTATSSTWLDALCLPTPTNPTTLRLPL